MCPHTFQGRLPGLHELMTLGAIALVLFAGGLFAQPYPSRPVRMIVPNLAGSATDTVARMVAQRFAESWGHQVVVDNRAGASGMIGHELTARAAPDGYTLLMSTSAGLIITPMLTKAPYDSARDFAPVSLVVVSPQMLVSHPGVPATNVEELVALARAKPGQLNCASPGTGTSNHLGCEMLKVMAKVSFLHVPYKGTSLAVNDVVGGQVQFMFNSMPAVWPLAKAGKLRALAHAGTKRSPAAPEVPTPDHDTLLQRQIAFGYTFEDVRMLMVPMARDGVEAVGSMGTDTPIAVLSQKPQLLYNYFKQLFAQVTNPPLDAIREELVTSIGGTLGPESNLLAPGPESCRQIVLPHPILDNEDLAKLRYIDEEGGVEGFKPVTIDILYPVVGGGDALRIAIEHVRHRASDAIAGGANLIILSDRYADHEHAPIPALLAVAAVGVVISIYYYFGWIKAAFFETWAPSTPETAPTHPPRTRVDLLAGVTLGVLALASVVLGFYQGPIGQWLTSK